MFGTYRTILAVVVAAQHLMAVPRVGHYAVNGFFILSGYLMTLIMHATYGYGPGGVGRFSLNRFLRLYPIYWCVLAVSVGIIMFFGEEEAQAYRKFMYLPETWGGWLANLTLIYPDWIPPRVSPRISPPTWALTIELTYYLLIALGLSRTLGLTLIWLAAGVAYMAGTHLLGLDYQYRYSSLAAGSVPLALGALIYHTRDAMGKWLPEGSGRWVIGLVGAAALLNPLVVFYGFRGHSPVIHELSYYLNYGLHAVLIIFLCRLVTSESARRLDSRVGDFSYPIYVMHWQVGFLVTMLLWGGPVRETSPAGVATYLLAIGVSFLCSWGLIRLVDQPIQRFRRAVRGGERTAASPA